MTNCFPDRILSNQTFSINLWNLLTCQYVWLDDLISSDLILSTRTFNINFVSIKMIILSSSKILVNQFESKKVMLHSGSFGIDRKYEEALSRMIENSIDVMIVRLLERTILM